MPLIDDLAALSQSFPQIGQTFGNVITQRAGRNVRNEQIKELVAAMELEEKDQSAARSFLQMGGSPNAFVDFTRRLGKDDLRTFNDFLDESGRQFFEGDRAAMTPEARALVEFRSGLRKRGPLQPEKPEFDIGSVKTENELKAARLRGDIKQEEFVEGMKIFKFDPTPKVEKPPIPTSAAFTKVRARAKGQRADVFTKPGNVVTIGRNAYRKLPDSEKATYQPTQDGFHYFKLTEDAQTELDRLSRYLSDLEMQAASVDSLQAAAGGRPLPTFPADTAGATAQPFESDEMDLDPDVSDEELMDILENLRRQAELLGAGGQ
jgi:hypothetical protein